jgi:hypothetical protein
MFRHFLIALAALVSPVLASECLVTLAPSPAFIPPAPHGPNPEPSSVGASDHFWYGTDVLWTALSFTGSWHALPHDAKGYSQKVFVWSKDYDPKKERQPNLVITGRRLDGDSPSFVNARSTNAGSAMLAGVNIPSLGCWEITSQFREHILTFSVAVEP